MKDDIKLYRGWLVGLAGVSELRDLSKPWVELCNWAKNRCAGGFEQA